MELLNALISFLVIMSLIVFIHEYGHFIVARIFKVQIEEFSIGFGKKIFGFCDKKGTEWKFSLIPMGGYVKMFGDENPASQPSKSIQEFTEEQKQKSFYFKPLYQKFCIVFAGPLFNYLLGFVIFFFLIYNNGISKTSNVINEIVDNSPAYFAGLQSKDKVVSINNRKVLRFGDIQKTVQMHPDKKLDFEIIRNGNKVNLYITPELVQAKDFLGNTISVGRIGVTSEVITFEDTGLLQSINLAFYELFDLSRLTLIALKQIVVGERSLSDLSGPVKIAKYSSQITEKAVSSESKFIDFALIFWFVALISINLGLANLLPIPLLDGGHLFFYMIEAVIRRPVPLVIQQVLFKIGFVFLIVLFVLITVNDLRSVLL